MAVATRIDLLCYTVWLEIFEGYKKLAAFVNFVQTLKILSSKLFTCMILV